MSEIDLNRFDGERFEVDEEYQDQVRTTQVGVACEILATSMTLQDCAEYLAVVKPEMLHDFMVWADQNYPELDIDAEEAVHMVKKALADNNLGIKIPAKVG